MHYSDVEKKKNGEVSLKASAVAAARASSPSLLRIMMVVMPVCGSPACQLRPGHPMSVQEKDDDGCLSGMDGSNSICTEGSWGLAE